ETLSVGKQITHSDNRVCAHATHGSNESGFVRVDAAAKSSNALRRGGIEQTTARGADKFHGREEPVARLSAMLSGEVPQLRHAAVLIDSPRWPGDLDWSRNGVVSAEKPGAGRAIDSALRALAAHCAILVETS